MANRGPDLEGALLRVGQELDYPPMADISPLVRATVEREPHRRPLFRMPHLGLPVLRPPAVFRPAWQAVVAAGVGLLLGEFTGDISREAMDKFTQGATLAVVRVDGTNGFWLEHGHAVGYADPRGQMVADDLRLAGNVLLWEQGPLTIRIESALS